MIVQALTFYLFAAVLLAAALMVISARNPVHSVLFLILSFFTAGGLFVLMGAEFLAMILVIVYVGAVAVLFLFVVMMLDINFVELRQGFLVYLPAGALVGLIMLVELFLVIGSWAAGPELAAMAAAPTPALTELLLVAMIGAIVLTHRVRQGVRKQKISDQVSRRREDSVELKKVTPRGGI